MVPNHGLGLWLRQYLAERDGVAAGLEMPLPGSFVWQVLRRIDGDVPSESPYRKAVLAWRAWRWLALEPPARFRDYLEAVPGVASERRFDLARQIADVFDRYLVYRPDLLAAWARELPPDGDAAWQAALWRRIVAETATPDPAARISEITRRLERDPALAAGIPPVAVFGIASLPPPTLALLAALGMGTDVELFVLTPCRQYWSDIVEPRVAAEARVSDGAAAAAYYATGNPLLGSMGRLGREFVDLAIEIVSGHPAGLPREAFELPQGETLLAHTQREMLDLTVRGLERRPDEAELERNAGKFEVQPGDASISVHVCASLVREVEVLHDQLLARFEADPSLEPRDVVVLTPDVVHLAPVVEAVFGNRDGRRFIPYAISDRVPRVESAVADVFKALLALPESRMTRTTVLSLASAPVVAGKLGFSADDLALIGHWVEEAGVYWGLDAAHLRRLHVEPEQPPARGLGTWGTGIDRILAGYAMAPGEVLDVGGAGILPLAGIEGRAAVVAGILGEFVADLGRVAAELRRPAAASAWRRRLEFLLRHFFDAEGESALAVKLIGDAIGDLEKDLAEAGIEEEIPLAVIQRWFDGELGGAFIGQGFPSGAVTFATLTPMRAIPFRFVALVGMNDADFPRVERPISFDLMADSRRKGDPSRRVEDRYLFIEALLSARDALHISYTGMAQRDATPMLPSVVVSELLDYLAAACCRAQDTDLPAPKAAERLLEQVTTEHPLQPFSGRYGRVPGLLTFEHYEAGPGAGELASAAGPPAPAAMEALRLTDLERFVSAPARAWFEARLGTRLAVDAEHWQDDEPFVLEGLGRWQVRNDALEALGWMDEEAWLAQMELDARLPYGVRRRELIREVREEVLAMRERIGRRAGGSTGSEAIDLHIAGSVLVGRVPDIGPKARVVPRVGRARARDLARLWLIHLVLCASGRPLESWLVDEERDRGLAVLPAGEARARLAELIDLARMNVERPLPLLCASGMHRVAPADVREAAGLPRAPSKALEEDFRDEHTARVWGKPHEPEGLGEFAVRVYSPLFEVLTIE